MNRRLASSLLAVTMSVLPSRAFAQSGTQHALGVVPGKEEAKTESPKAGLGVLSQLDLNAGSKTAQAGIQALDLYMNNVVRMYTRLTLPLASSSAVSDKSVLPQVAVGSLLDPYGGVLNISAGAFKQLVNTVNHPDKDHGLFIDGRLGLKFVELPGQSERAPSIAGATVSPFYSGAAMLKFIHQLYTDGGMKDVAGGVEIGVGFVGNYSVDTSVSSAFGDKLVNRWSGGMRVDVLINLPGIAGMNFSWNPNTFGSSAFGKNFLVGIKLFNQNPSASK